MAFEMVCFYKYLGVQIEARPTALYYKAYEQVIVKKAKKYVNLIRVKSRAYPDVGAAAQQLWESVALPSILYGMESTAVSRVTLNTLDSLQARIGKYILQVPRCTQNVCAVVGCDLIPIKFVIMDRVYGLAVRMLNSESHLVQEALQVMEGQGEANLFFKQVEELLPLLDSEATYQAYRERQLSLYVSQELFNVRKTTFLFSPQGSLSLEQPPYSLLPAEYTGDLNKFLFMNAGLGNRHPTKEGIKFRVCVPCALVGSAFSMDEVHLVLVCPRYTGTRRELGIEDLVNDIVQQHGGGEDGYAVYWGKGKDLHVDHLQWRVECALKLREIYLTDIVDLKPIYYRYRCIKYELIKCM